MSEDAIGTFQASWAGQTTNADGETTVKIKVPTSEYAFVKDLPLEARERPLIVSVFVQQLTVD